MDDTSSEVTDVRGWYVAGTYRLNKRFSFGSYYSRYTVTDALGGAVATIAPSQMDTGAPASHTYDKVVTASINFNRFWNLKIEGHFMEGYGNSGYPAGFYPSLNPNGFAPSTNALVLRTAFHF